MSVIIEMVRVEASKGFPADPGHDPAGADDKMCECSLMRLRRQGCGLDSVPVCRIPVKQDRISQGRVRRKSF